MHSGSYAIRVGCYFHICLRGFSQDLHLKTWHCSSTLLLCFILRSWATERHVLFYETDCFIIGYGFLVHLWICANGV